MVTKIGLISADYKVKGGKLLRVRLSLGAPETPGLPATIQTIQITGDFFMHPEERIEQLEALLTGAEFTALAIEAQVRAFFETDVQVIGAEADDFVHLILSAH